MKPLDKFDASSPPASHQDDNLLLKLPAELRVKVYEEFFSALEIEVEGSDKTVTRMRTVSNTGTLKDLDLGPKAMLSVLQTSRLIRQEALPVCLGRLDRIKEDAESTYKRDYQRLEECPESFIEDSQADPRCIELLAGAQIEVRRFLITRQVLKFRKIVQAREAVV